MSKSERRNKLRVNLALKLIDECAPTKDFGDLPLPEKIKSLGQVYEISVPNEFSDRTIVNFVISIILARQKLFNNRWGSKKLEKLRKFKVSKHSYKNGDNRPINEFYKSWEWKRLRYDFLIGKNRTCECCGAKPGNGVSINVDHIKPIRHYWDLRLNKNNLQILCEDCNMGKGSRDETNWTKENVISLDLVREQLKIRE